MKSYPHDAVSRWVFRSLLACASGDKQVQNEAAGFGLRRQKDRGGEECSMDRDRAVAHEASTAKKPSWPVSGRKATGVRHRGEVRRITSPSFPGGRFSALDRRLCKRGFRARRVFTHSVAISLDPIKMVAPMTMRSAPRGICSGGMMSPRSMIVMEAKTGAVRSNTGIIWRLFGGITSAWQ
jgi:hypothetical protein